MREAAEYVNDFYTHNATGRSCEVERVVCVILLSPRERAIYKGGKSRRSARPTTTGTEIENRFVSSLEHCESSRGPSPLPSTSYCFDLNNILNNTLCAFHLDEVSGKIYISKIIISWKG